MLLQIHLQSRLNNWLQWIGQRQPARRDVKHLSLRIWFVLYCRCDGKYIYRTVAGDVEAAAYWSPGPSVLSGLLLM